MVPMDHAARLQAIIAADPVRWRILDLVRSLHLPDCWVGAGFIRNAVWSNLHGRSACPITGDVDIVWFDTAKADASQDRKLEAILLGKDPSVAWSVKNQARMHVRNDDSPYQSVADSMYHWPETATAIAVRRNDQDNCDISAPLGLDDLFDLVLRPTPHFLSGRREAFEDRIRTKGWLTTWPNLRIASV